ncbi:hypothetical protein ACSBR2_007744 [Camellia fascicularis]
MGNGSNETDQLALLALKSKITDDPFKLFTSWNDSVHFCQWNGVTCGRRHHQRVVLLDLRSLKLSGNISPFIGNLSFLRALHLQNNSFIHIIPPELGRLRRLEVLHFNNNSISGEILANLSICSKLIDFDVAYNNLVGQISVEFGSSLQKLQFIHVAHNELSGGLPSFYGNLSYLHKFSATENNFQGIENDLIGGVPTMEKLHKLHRFSIETNHLGSGHNVDLGFLPSLNNATGLVLLNLGDNNFGGMLTETIGNLSTKLRRILLGYNQISGSIPYGIRNLINLDIIRLAGNHFTGNLPFDIGKLQNLHDLHLSENEFSGNIPSSLGNLSSLITPDLSQNSLHGSIPPRLGGCKNLLSLNLAHNKLSGPIPQLIGKLQNLQELNLINNSLSGNIPSSLGNLSLLSELVLGTNNFQGNIPQSLGNCNNLQLLFLSQNNLNGMLTETIGNLSTNLQNMDLDQNQILGSIPSVIGNLINLERLWLSENQFTGTIPTNLGILPKMQLLSFEMNHLSGKIPDSIGNLSLLIELYLGDNRLEETIPSGLANCKKLLLLHLYQNNLSGNIPKDLLKVSSLSISLNLAWNRLSGSLPTEVENLKNLMELDISENRLSGEIPSSLGIQNFDLSHNNLSGKIPTFLEKFSLMILNLSFNDFEGELPMEGVFANASAISIVGNHRHCGGISELQLASCITKKSKHKMPLSHILAITAASVLVGAALLSFFTIYLFKKQRTAQSTVPVLKESFLKVSYEKLLKPTDGFSSANLIGFGGFGSVYRGILIRDQKFVAAIKVLNLQNRGAIKSFMAECETLRNIRHRNLVRIITSCSSVDFQGNEFKALVYEFMPNGSLERWLHASLETNDGQNEQQRLNLLQRINIAIDVACALDYLHHQCQTPIIHCDLKPSNILLDRETVAQIGDFGLARFLPELTNPNQSSSIGVRGTIGYVAPEYGLGSEMSTYGDVYSYGILLLEIITGKRPTDSMFEEGLNLHRFSRMAFPNHVMEIVDPVLLDNDEEQAGATATTTVVGASTWESIQENNGDRMRECLISIVKIGVACSIESPQG